MCEETLFHEALAIAPADRAAFLDAACLNQPALRQAVEALLAAHVASASLLDQPAVDPNLTGAYTPPPGGATGVHVPQEAQPGYVIAGRYTLEQKIGEGGMGEVWVAKQTEPVKRKVALKLIKAGMDSKAVLQRFEAERQALALMDHPNIAKVLDGGLTQDRHPFFVMELVNGLPLSKFCDEAKLTPQERLELFVPICQAVQHAHQKGIIHRDLKPGNILVTLIDGKPIPKVIDFGVAKATAGKLTDESLSTNFGAVVGTLEYMAPEQAGYSGEDIDTRADIYSLGVILYEMLTGLRPLDSKRLKKAALTEMIRIIREEEPSKPSTRLSTDKSLPSLAALRQTEPKKLMALLRGELDWVVMKCLEKQRERRYETANGLARDIQRYLADEVVEARPPSFGYRAGKLLRRHRGSVVTVGLVLLTLLAGIAGTTWGMFQEAERAEGERTAKHEAMVAAAAEKKANAEAHRRLRQVEKGSALLASVFSDVDPRSEDKEGKPLRVLLGDRLTNAAEQLEGEAVGDPLLVAGLQNRLGESLLNLGLADRAIPLFTKAWTTRTTHLGPNHVDTLESMGNLAVGYRVAGQLDRAVRLQEENLQLRKAHLSATHPDTLGSMNNLAVSYRLAGRLDLALPLHEETLKLRQTYLGTDHPDTLVSMNSLASGYKAVGQLDRAISLYEETLKLRKAKLGDHHTDTLNSMNNLATAYQDASQVDQALALYEATLQLRKTHLGTDHPDTLRSMNNLAEGYRVSGKLDLAVSLHEETLKARKTRLPADHPEIFNSMNNLALAYQAIGKLDLALPLYEEAVKLQKAQLGVDHPRTLTSINNLALGYEAIGKPELAIKCFQEAASGIEQRQFRHPDAGRIITNLINCQMRLKQFDQAETWRRRWLAVVKMQAGVDSLPYATELAALGAILLPQQKWTEAEAVLRASLAIAAQKAPKAWLTSYARSLLGGALLGQKKYADAEPLLLAGYEGMKQLQSKIPPQGKIRLIEALERLVQLYDVMGKKDELAKWQIELETARQKTPGNP